MFKKTDSSSCSQCSGIKCLWNEHQRYSVFAFQRLNRWHVCCQLPEEESGPVQLQRQHGESGPSSFRSSAPEPPQPSRPQWAPPGLLVLPTAVLRQVLAVTRSVFRRKRTMWDFIVPPKPYYSSQRHSLYVQVSNTAVVMKDGYVVFQVLEQHWPPPQQTRLSLLLLLHQFQHPRVPRVHPPLQLWALLFAGDRPSERRWKRWAAAATGWRTLWCPERLITGAWAQRCCLHTQQRFQRRRREEAKPRSARLVRGHRLVWVWHDAGMMWLVLLVARSGGGVCYRGGSSGSMPATNRHSVGPIWGPAASGSSYEGAPAPPRRSDSYAAIRSHERPNSWSSLEHARSLRWVWSVSRTIVYIMTYSKVNVMQRTYSLHSIYTTTLLLLYYS